MAICINYTTCKAEAEAAAGEIAATGGRVIAIQADVAAVTAMARMRRVNVDGVIHTIRAAAPWV